MPDSANSRWLDPWIAKAVELHGGKCYNPTCKMKHRAESRARSRRKKKPGAKPTNPTVDTSRFILVRRNAPVAWSRLFQEGLDVFDQEYVLVCRTCAALMPSGRVNIQPMARAWHLHLSQSVHKKYTHQLQVVADGLPSPSRKRLAASAELQPT